MNIVDIYAELKELMTPLKKRAELQFYQTFKDRVEDLGGKMLRSDPDAFAEEHRTWLALFKDKDGKENIVAAHYSADERSGFVIADIDEDWDPTLTEFGRLVLADPANK